MLPLSVVNSPVIFSPLLSRLLLSPLLTPLFPHPSLYSNSSSSSWPPSSLSSSSSSCRCSSSSSSSTCSTCSGRACSRSLGLHPARLPCQDRPCNHQVSEGRRALVKCFFFVLSLLFTYSVYSISDYTRLHRTGMLFFCSSSLPFVLHMVVANCLLFFLSLASSDCSFVLCLSPLALPVFVVFLSFSLFPCSLASLLPSSVVFVIVVHCLQW